MAAPRPASVAPDTLGFGSSDKRSASSGARQSLTAGAFEAVHQALVAQMEQRMNQALQEFRMECLATMQEMFDTSSQSQRVSEVHEVHEVESTESR